MIEVTHRSPGVYKLVMPSYETLRSIITGLHVPQRVLDRVTAPVDWNACWDRAAAAAQHHEILITTLEEDPKSFEFQKDAAYFIAKACQDKLIEAVLAAEGLR